MIEMSFQNNRGFTRLKQAKLDRIALEGGGSIVRLQFSDSANNYLQVDLSLSEAGKLLERIKNKRIRI